MDDRRHRFAARLGSRLRGGIVLGASAGMFAGLVAGILNGSGTTLVLMWVLGVGLGLGILGAIWGGFFAIESPDPGREPFQTPKPAFESALTEERNRRLPNDASDPGVSSRRAAGKWLSMTIQVWQVMASEPRTMGSDMSASDAAGLMALYDIGVVPVVGRFGELEGS